MKEIFFSGASDDLIHVWGDGAPDNLDEIGAERATFVVSGSSGAIRVFVEFTRGGTWHVGVSPYREVTSWPDSWMIRINKREDVAKDYSAQLSIAYPDEEFITVVREYDPSNS